MKGNPHYDDATYVDRGPQIRMIDAILTVAHEVRTSNLLAVTEKQYLPGANDEVKERLGHGRGVEPPTPTTPDPAEVFEAALKEVKRVVSRYPTGFTDVSDMANSIVEALRLRGCL